LRKAGRRESNGKNSGRLSVISFQRGAEKCVDTNFERLLANGHPELRVDH